MLEIQLQDNKLRMLLQYKCKPQDIFYCDIYSYLQIVLAFKFLLVKLENKYDSKKKNFQFYIFI